MSTTTNKKFMKTRSIKEKQKHHLIKQKSQQDYVKTQLQTNAFSFANKTAEATRKSRRSELKTRKPHNTISSNSFLKILRYYNRALPSKK